MEGETPQAGHHVPLGELLLFPRVHSWFGNKTGHPVVRRRRFGQEQQRFIPRLDKGRHQGQGILFYDVPTEE